MPFERKKKGGARGGGRPGGKGVGAQGKEVSEEYLKKKMLHIQEKDVVVNGDVVHADQGCHGIVLWP